MSDDRELLAGSLQAELISGYVVIGSGFETYHVHQLLNFRKAGFQWVPIARYWEAPAGRVKPLQSWLAAKGLPLNNNTATEWLQKSILAGRWLDGSNPNPALPASLENAEIDRARLVEEVRAETRYGRVYISGNIQGLHRLLDCRKARLKWAGKTWEGELKYMHQLAAWLDANGMKLSNEAVSLWLRKSILAERWLDGNDVEPTTA